MRLAPTDGRRTLTVHRSLPEHVIRGLVPFGSLRLLVERRHEGGERHDLAVLPLLPLLVFLRRLPAQHDARELQLGGWRRKLLEARMALDDPCLPRVLGLGLLDGEVFEISDYVFGVDLRAAQQAGLTLPFSVAAGLFRELLSALTKMRAAACLPHRLLRARNLRFSLERGTAAVRICCNQPLPSSSEDLSVVRRPRELQEPSHGAQVRAVTELLLSISSPADETQRALLLDESHDAADVLADHMQINAIPLDAMSVAKIQFGSQTSLRWLEKSVARGQHALLTATAEDAELLEQFWARAFELAREDRAVFE